MIIPKKGDWVICYGFGQDSEPGKVINVDYIQQKFIGFFLNESGYECGGGGEEVERSFKDIKEILSDFQLIAEFEKEEKGKL